LRLDVETMDTTFKSTGASNIHFVKCSDCHSRNSQEASAGRARQSHFVRG